MLYKAIVATILLAVTAAPSLASDETKKTDTPIQAAIAREARSSETTLASWAVIDAQKRPATLTTLYGSYAALQVLDVVSTKRALDAGAREVNPVMRGNNMAATIGVKAAAGGATIYFAERMWKKNKVGAIAMMAALNGASAIIVARNQQHARR
jgi:hypothetical protein